MLKVDFVYSVFILFSLLTHSCPYLLQVARVAEEAAGTIAKNLAPEVCLQALSPVLRDADFPVNLAALKMTIKVIIIVSHELVSSPSLSGVHHTKLCINTMQLIPPEK